MISHFPLAHAKQRFETMEEVKSFIGEIVQRTNNWRLQFNLEPHRLQRCVRLQEALDCIRVLKIDLKLCKDSLIGENTPITCEFKSPRINLDQDKLDKKAREIRRG